MALRQRRRRPKPKHLKPPRDEDFARPHFPLGSLEARVQILEEKMSEKETEKR